MQMTNELIQVVAHRASCIIGHRGYQALQSKFEAAKTGYTMHKLSMTSIGYSKPVSVETKIVDLAKIVATDYMLENGYDWNEVIYPRLRARYKKEEKEDMARIRDKRKASSLKFG
ncbi:hypothetical protein PaMx35_ORF48 [Pseudomonas phage PaMx35]|nr:hypothetical protein PaMx35_ORF48 [Pseudomonas phage PaMx35]